MVETITPVVHGGRGRWLGALALHVAGAVLTAAAFGAILGALGGLLGAPFGRAGLATVAALAAAYAAAELTGVRIPVPQLRRQVPAWWRTFFGRPVAAALYGAGLGVGFLTYLRHGTLVVVAAAAFASGRPGLGAILVAPFGLVRGLSAATAWDATSPERGRALVDRLAAIPDRWRRRANGAALLAVAALAVAAARASAPGGWTQLAVAALALAFAWAALAKVLAPRRWRRTLDAHALPSPLARVARWGVPVAESLVPALVLLGRPAAAAAWALALLAGFTAEVLRIRRGGGRVPCGCFGSRTSVGTSSALRRNAALAAVAVVVGAFGEPSSPIGWPGSPEGGDVVPFIVTLGAVLASALVAWRAGSWLAAGRARTADGSAGAGAGWGSA
jgi:hypothetical protein